MRHAPTRRSAIIAGVGGLLLSLCACTFPGQGPDADDSMADLAKALSSGKLTGVDLAGGDAAANKAVTEYEQITGGAGDAKVTVGSVSTDGDKATGKLDWSWKVGSKTWSYDTTVQLAKGKTSDGDAWLVHWAPTVVEPSLKQGERLVETTVKAERGRILGAKDQPLVSPRPVLRVGLDKTGLSAAQATDSGRRLAVLAGHRRQGLPQAGQGHRAEGLRRGHRLPPAGRAGRRDGRPLLHQGCRCGLRQAAARAQQGLRGRDPRHRRPGDRRAGQGEQGPDPGRRRRWTVRPPEEVRRTAGRHPRRHRHGPE